MQRVLFLSAQDFGSYKEAADLEDAPWVTLPGSCDGKACEQVAGSRQ